MKSLLSTFAMILAVMALTVTTGLAQGKNRSKTVNLNENLMVGETLLEKGEYRMKFDAASNELHVEKDGKVVQRVKARVVENERKAAYHSLETRQSDRGKMLMSVKFEGDRRTILVGDQGGGSVAGEGQN